MGSRDRGGIAVTFALGVTAHSRIAELLSAEVVCVGRDSSLQDAAVIMRAANVSAVLVDGGAAIVTERDVTSAFAAGCTQSTLVADVAVHDPVTVSADTSVVGAAAEMLAKNVRHLVITSGDAVVGVVSLRPVMQVLAQA